MFQKCVFALAALIASNAANATPSDDPLRYFAGCLGRVSAEWSHAATYSDTVAVSQAEALRGQLEVLVSLLTPEGAARDVMAIRLEARTAHAALLSRATTSDDTWAAARAQAFLDECAAQIVMA